MLISYPAIASSPSAVNRLDNVNLPDRGGGYRQIIYSGLGA
jgi:hypothetical protein